MIITVIDTISSVIYIESYQIVWKLLMLIFIVCTLLAKFYF